MVVPVGRLDRGRTNPSNTRAPIVVVEQAGWLVQGAAAAVAYLYLDTALPLHVLSGPHVAGNLGLSQRPARKGRRYSDTRPDLRQQYGVEHDGQYGTISVPERHQTQQTEFGMSEQQRTRQPATTLIDKISTVRFTEKFWEGGGPHITTPEGARQYMALGLSEFCDCCWRVMVLCSYSAALHERTAHRSCH